MKNFEIISIPKIQDRRGNLSVLEGELVPFDIKRVYYLFDVPAGSKRGGHAHKKLTQILIALSGSFDVVLKNGEITEVVTLNNPIKGLVIKPGTWREIENFSSGAVCLVLASLAYDEADYIRDFKTYLQYLVELSE